MEKKVEILAYHGWGFDATFWNNFEKIVPESIGFKTANRGYYGRPFHPRFDPDTKFKVVFTHSFGLHWCNSAILSKADALVIFNGFGDFFAITEKLRAISKAGLESLISGFENDPKETLHDFMNKCFYPSELNWRSDSVDSDTDLLLQDLKQLTNTRFPLIDLDFGSVMIAVDGAKDKILLEPRGESIIEPHYWKKFSEIIPKEGHALPFTNPVKCWRYLCSILPIFERYESNR